MKLLHNHKWSEPCNALSCPVSYALSKGKKVAGEWAPDSAVDVRRELEAELDALLKVAREALEVIDDSIPVEQPVRHPGISRRLSAAIAKYEGMES